MSVIGRGVIEVSADSSGLNAAIDKAKKSISGLGDASKEASTKSAKSIDAYIARLEKQRGELGKNSSEIALYRLKLRGASDEQLRAAATSLKLTDAFKRGEAIGDKISSGFRTFGLVAATSLIAASVAFDQLIKKAGDFQDLAEKTGDTAQNIASLAVAAGTAGVQMDTVVGAATKLTKNLTGVDDESKAAGAALAALGINISDFKALKPADQIEQVGKALNGFEEGAAKSAVAMALFGKSGADLLPFLKEIGAEGGRQVILTEQQIKQADEYADKQAKLRAEIGLYSQAIAADFAPALLEFTQSIAELVKDQNFAATASALLKDALQATVVIFQTIAVLGSDVAFVFKSIATGVNAAIERLDALRRFDFGKFTAIGDAVEADLANARKNLDGFQAKVLSIGKKKPEPENFSNEGRNSPPPAEPKKKTLNFEGAGKKKKGGGSGGGGVDKAAQEAKTRLAADLEDIRKASDATINAFTNAEKILEARRSAALVDEGDYYAAKLGFLRLNSDAQERALQQELARLQAEKGKGKDRIDNDRKIADTQGKIAKLRENAVTNVEVLATQEAAANAKIAQSYVDATNAANAYITTITKRNQREIAGIGQGVKFREEEEGRNEIEDKFVSERQTLERDLRRNDITKKEFDTYLAIAQDTYAKEVALYNQRTDEIDKRRADGFNGAREALANYADESKDVAAQIESATTSALGGLEDAFVEFAKTGKLSFKDLIGSITADLTRIAVKESITGPLADFIKGQIGGLGKTAAGLLGATAPAAVPVPGAIAGAAVDVAGAAAQTAAVTASTAAFTAQIAATTAATAADTAAAAATAAITTATTSSAAAMTALTQAALSAASALSSISAASAATSSGSSDIFGKLIGAAIGAATGVGDPISNDISGSIFSATGTAVRGRRAIGGPVSANGLYEVNERGPELLQVAGKQYLMTGNQSGTVSPTSSTSGESRTVNVSINQSFAPGTDRTTTTQAAAQSAQAARRALVKNT